MASTAVLASTFELRMENSPNQANTTKIDSGIFLLLCKIPYIFFSDNDFEFCVENIAFFQDLGKTQVNFAK